MILYTLEKGEKYKLKAMLINFAIKVFLISIPLLFYFLASVILFILFKIFKKTIRYIVHGNSTVEK